MHLSRTGFFSVRVIAGNTAGPSLRGRSPKQSSRGACSLDCFARQFAARSTSDPLAMTGSPPAMTR
ncbi:MAG: hypothetical protein LBT00_04840 [Spirochaetaceae bacterium]|nr:hypothetical protein [Spirochaetaceae bacterium]